MNSTISSPKETNKEHKLEEIMGILPPHLRTMIASLSPDVLKQLEEIRLRLGRPLALIGGNGSVSYTHLHPTELLDGVKVYHPQGWSLVLPDPEEPLCRVFSEGASMEIAESLTEFYVEKINRMINE